MELHPDKTRLKTLLPLHSTMGFIFLARLSVPIASEKSAKSAGVTAQQHLAVLSIKAFDGQATVGDLARDLMTKHHSAVGLADRLVRAGLIVRNSDPADRRRVTLALTPRGEAMLLAVSGANREELRRLTPHLQELLTELER